MKQNKQISENTKKLASEVSDFLIEISEEEKECEHLSVEEIEIEEGINAGLWWGCLDCGKIIELIQLF